MRLSELRQLISEVAGDAYKILGLERSASADQIKAAYRQKAVALHPDKNPGKDTTKDMAAVNVAYGILSDPKKRAMYDMMGDKTVDTLDGSKFTARGAASGSTYGYGSGGGVSQQDVEDMIRRKREQWARQDREARERREAEERRRREASKAEPSPRPNPPSAERKRYFEFHDDASNSHKFWWIKPDVTAGTVTVGWGRIGSPGQTKVHNVMGFVNKTLGKMIRSKTAKGYVEKDIKNAPGYYAWEPPSSTHKASSPSNVKAMPSAQAKIGDTVWVRHPNGTIVPAVLRSYYMGGFMGLVVGEHTSRIITNWMIDEGYKAKQAAPAPKKSSGPKTTYKVYGKKGPASVHTRYKGVAYGPTQSSKFKAGQQARVSVGSDKRANVVDPTTDHTQTWDPIPEAFCTMVGDMILEAMEMTQ